MSHLHFTHRSIFVTSAIFQVLAFFLFTSCGKSTEEKGEVLAKTYCASCHAFTPPALLDKKTWLIGVLPAMGPRLAMTSYKGQNYPALARESVIPKGLYPTRPVMAQDEWEAIVEYFVNTAPDSLQHPERILPIPVTGAYFKNLYPAYDEKANPTTSCVKIDVQSGLIFCANSVPPQLNVYNAELKLLRSTKTDNVVTDLEHHGDSTLVLIMGSLNPYDVTTGQLQWLVNGNSTPQVLEQALPRPVQITASDLDQDSRTDYLICGFGNFTGSLFWLRSEGNSKFSRQDLRNLPGAMKTTVGDYNKDGLPDIIALMAQGDEGIFLYQNEGKGKFKEKSLLSFPPVYGTTSFELQDFNADGNLDILYTCGDNADYSKILKPYHGIYIYLNDGQWNFTQRFFYPINGCFKGLARDFDGDGDLDLASISFFADYLVRPKESFVFLKNNGEFNFEASTVPAYADGRWLTMDAGDYDSDGDEDIILGNMSIGPSNMNGGQEWKSRSPFVILQNSLKDKTH